MIVFDPHKKHKDRTKNSLMYIILVSRFIFVLTTKHLLCNDM